jgi:hypothetical protein
MIIWKLSRIMPQKRLKMISEGIFFSLLNYCIEIYGNVWGLDTYDDQARRSSAYTKEDNLKLQTITNKVLWSLTGLDRDKPVTTLHNTSGQLSFHQRCALYTITSVHKAIRQKQPAYIFSQFQFQTNQAMHNTAVSFQERSQEMGLEEHSSFATLRQHEINLDLELNNVV